MTSPAPNDTARETMRFGYGDTTLGTMVVAESVHGVAALFIGDDRAQLLSDLNDSFRGIDFVLDQTGLAQTIAKAVAMIEAPQCGTDLPLDLRGSRLELSVWTTLRGIPAGETRTYGTIMRYLPMPATALEVGAACAANRIAVAVPCHRVVKSDGSISGYRWGVQRKRRLLKIERAA
jgi:AraC family transcriptional regulator of adaptative response/methylated-DNA-[protein]-cysteine methyltransferase